MRQFNTLTGFLGSKASNPTTSDTVEFQGFTAIGDGYAAKFQHNGVTGQTPSQSPIDLGLAVPTLNDLDGNQWVLIDGAVQEFDTVLFYPSPFGDSGKGMYAYLESVWVKLSDTTFIPPMTTTELISSTASFSSDIIIPTTGFTSSGDGGSGSWIQNGVTGQTASQSPAQLVDALLNDASGNQWGLVSGGVVNVRTLGAVGDLGTDDTLSIEAAVGGMNSSAGGVVYFPKGKYKVTSSISCSPVNDIVFRGDGEGVTQIRSTVAGSPTLLFGDHIGSALRIFIFEGISIQYDGSIPPVAGTVAIHTKNIVSPSKLQNFSIQKFYDGLKLEATGLLGNVMISNFVIGNTESKGIYLLGGTQGVWLTDGKITARQDGGPVTGSIAIYMKYCNGVYMKSLDCLLNDRGIFVSPNATETVHWIFGDQVVLDTNTSAGLDINPQGGTVNGFFLSNSWASSNQGEGVKIRGSAPSVVDGINLQVNALKNDLQGVRLTGGPTTFKNIKIHNSLILSNNQSNTGVPGVQVDGNVGGFTIQNNTIGASDLFTNFQAYGVRVFPGTSDNYLITGNDLHDNITSGLNDGGTGINKVVNNNLL